MKGWYLESMNRNIFLTVRSGSRRLIQKCYLTSKGLPNIVRLIRNLRRSKEANLLVLCTTELPEDDRLCDIARDEGISFYRGSAEDKLDRWNKACPMFDTEFFVAADGDDLFADTDLIDLTIQQWDNNKADFIKPEGLVCGAVGYGIRAYALSQVCRDKDTTDTEMMWPYFLTGKFKVEDLQDVPEIYKRPEIRATLDYEEDFAFFNEVINNFSGPDFTLKDVIQLVDRHPELLKINQFRQKDFLDNQKAKTKLVLK